MELMTSVLRPSVDARATSAETIVLPRPGDLYATLIERVREEARASEEEAQAHRGAVRGRRRARSKAPGLEVLPHVQLDEVDPRLPGPRARAWTPPDLRRIEARLGPSLATATELARRLALGWTTNGGLPVAAEGLGFHRTNPPARFAVLNHVEFLVLLEPEVE